MKIKLLIIFCGLLSAGVMLSGCSGIKGTLAPELMDKSPFTGNPCAAPCWYGLEIRISDESEVVSTLKSLNFLDEESLQIDSTSVPGFDSKNLVPGKIIRADCLRSKYTCLVLKIADGKLRDVGIFLKMPIDEVVAYIGNPDKVGFDACCAESMECYIELVWIKQQLVLTSAPFQGAKGCKYSQTVVSSGLVDSDLEIVMVDFLPIEDIKRIIADSQTTGNYQGINPKK